MRVIFKRNGKAQGFTLVELLIVLIIIGVLAGMLMLAMGASKDKFTATKIMSNLRTIKSSIAIYQSDTGKTIPEDGKLITLGNGTSSLDKYVDNAPNGYFVYRDTSKFCILFDGNASDPKIEKDSGVWDSLSKMNEDIGLSVDKENAKVYMYLAKDSK